MRVTGGIFRGRKIQGTPGHVTRPTADKVRQSIFNILMNDIEGTSVLDIFAGSGALGIDAISRGAVSAVFIESGRNPSEAIKANLRSLQLEEEVLVIDYRKACELLARKRRKFDIIFADPPYEQVMPQQVIDTVLQYDLLSDNGLLIIEHKAGQAAESDRLQLLKKRKFGQTEVTFYARRQ